MELVYNPHQEFWDALRSGKSTHCPCCGRYAQIYKVRVHKGIVLALAAVWRVHGTTPCYIAKDFPKLRAVTVLKHWGLIAPADPPPKTDDQFDHSDPRRGRKGSWWQITQDGKLWITGEIIIPRWMKIFDDEVQSRSPRKFSFKQALKSHGFDFEEIMQGESIWLHLDLSEVDLESYDV